MGQIVPPNCALDDIQGDLLDMDVSSSVALAYTKASVFFQGTRTTRPCLSGKVVLQKSITSLQTRAYAGGAGIRNLPPPYKFLQIGKWHNYRPLAKKSCRKDILKMKDR